MIVLTNITQLVLMILSVGLFVSTLEYIKKIQIFAPNGLLSWNVMQLNWGQQDQKTFLKPLFKLFSQSGLATLFVIRCLLLVGLVFFQLQSVFGWILISLLAVSLLTSSLITRYGSDGSDQMSMLIVITLVLCHLPGLASPRLADIGLWFIGLQACLSYSVAGIAKLASAEWRASTAIRDVFSTKTYGSQKASMFLQKYPAANGFLCWNVMIMETLFPLCLFLPWPYAMIFLIWGFTFHFFTAVIMGLNSFFWAFMATYPALYFINHQMPWHLF
ncbi:hypothetical protein SAMN05421821_103242 [Mucilaginibacter lappiensis]|uniref:HTTM domain-containing protein n=1 Tax=Mucilaginibacter lappiensis TaxID=354630 RepID=A0ABR6PJ59_9SPHI|nr:hypothetical protein [Mucilaginibacter lappiensis]MBB6109005.1 hypothetical protein [Mucilaginibacter lappiensis]SIQ71572.1 hypothetical protein SAMN05421821_103242 [Mucilaginibacter lappiensis]